VRRLLPLTALGLALLALPAAAQAIPGAKPCRGQSFLRCATLKVPIDRTGTVGGTVGLKVAYQRGTKPVLVALTGGPGQSGVSFGADFALSLHSALRKYRLAVLDQRGTGGSGLLRCNALQKLTALEDFTPAAIAACGTSIGARRAYYGTIDTVADIEALRKALGSPKIALMGVSYGTYVAAQYARVHPDRVSRLILDSAVGPDGVDPLTLDTIARIPRILSDQCLKGGCRGVTSDPTADLETLIGRLHAGRPVTGTVFDRTGKGRTRSVRTVAQVFSLLSGVDLNSGLGSLLPGAIAAANAGDGAPLVRLLQVGDGGAEPATDLSYGLNVAATCDDVRLPFAFGDSFAVRQAKLQAAAAAVPAAERGPFSTADLVALSSAVSCVQWPGTPVPAGPSHAPLPNVPTLILGGGQDMRTPIENARAIAAQIPKATVVQVPGNGHDELDSDLTGCAAKALARFSAGTAIGTPCAGKSDQPPLQPLPPTALKQLVPAPGVAGDRGRVVTATRLTLGDAISVFEAYFYSGLPERDVPGGLRGGTVRIVDTNWHTGIQFGKDQYLRGVRVSGNLDVDNDVVIGEFRIDGPGSLDGRLSLSRSGRITGTIQGRRIATSRVGTRAAAAAAGATPAQLGLAPLPAWPTAPSKTPRAPLIR
jgi:pimeloyl-ACP methyl ester carboxylesterase